MSDTAARGSSHTTNALETVRFLGMGLDAVELRRLTLPMTAPFRTSQLDLTERDVLLVRVVIDGVDGWGECAALPEAGYDDVDVDTATAALRADLDHAPPVATAAVTTATFDARLRAEGRSLADWLGAGRRSVPAGVAVGFMPSLEELLDEVARHVETGYRRVKLKIGPGRDVELVRAVRAEFGESIALQVDANGAYRLEDAPALAALDEFDLLLIEQPLPRDDLAGHAELVDLINTPVCLDESIRSLADATRAIELGACSVICVKPGPLGGLDVARAVHDACVAAGVGAWCGGMLETGVGRAALLALAALPGFTLPGDLSATGRWYVDDLAPPVDLVGGELAVPTGPGIGGEPDPVALRRYTTWAETLRPGRP